MQNNTEFLPKYWKYLTHGLIPGEIQSNYPIKTQFITNDGSINFIISIYDKIISLKENEHLEIIEEKPFLTKPYNNTKKISSKSYKKNYPALRLQIPSESKRSKYKLGMAEVLKAEVDDYCNLGLYILRRGFGFYQGGRFFLIPQDDIMTGYRLASILANYQVPLKMQNTKDHFTLQLKSTSKNYESDELAHIILTNLAVCEDNDESYAYKIWPKFSFFQSSLDNKTINADDHNKINPSIDYPEIKPDFRVVASALLRNYFSNHPYEFIQKSDNFYELKKIPLNLFLQPTKRRIDLELKLNEQVYIMRKSKDQKIKADNLTNAEKEAFFSMDLFLNGFDNTFLQENDLKSLETTFKHFTDYFDKRTKNLILNNEEIQDTDAEKYKDNIIIASDDKVELRFNQPTLEDYLL